MISSWCRGGSTPDLEYDAAEHEGQVDDGPIDDPRE
jgi:hypothetical protein